MRNQLKEGILTAPLDVPELKQLASFMDVLPTVQPGQNLKITRDLATAPGIVLQVHASLQTCIDDLSFLRHMEDTVLYQVKPARVNLPHEAQRKPARVDLLHEEQVSS